MKISLGRRSERREKATPLACSRKVRRNSFVAGTLLVCAGLLITVQTVRAQVTPAYLMFQIFTDANPQLSIAPTVFANAQPQQMNFTVASKQQMTATVRDLVSRIGTTGSASRRLGFMVGPLALEYTDDQMRVLIRNAFQIAQEEQVAVGFHIDDSMFWFRRRDLWQDSRNVEWVDWSGTPNTGRRLDWNLDGTRLAPQMCFNARDIVSEVTRVARDVIGAEIQLGIAELERRNQPELFAGVIVGWETQIGKDFATNRALGFCGLTNKGYSQARPPLDIDAERELLVQEFIELWSSGFSAAGIDSRKLYSHTAFISRAEHAAIVTRNSADTRSFSEINNFAPPPVSFGQSYNPGFSTYPAPGLYEQLYEELGRHPDRIGWASAEGTNIRIGMTSGEETMEVYLARHFNHGATLVNLFGWGVGDAANPFRRVTESAESVAAYRKVLAGEPLLESSIPGNYGVPQKVQIVQDRLAVWLKAGGDVRSVKPLLEDMWRYLSAGRLDDAEAVMDRLLILMK